MESPNSEPRGEEAAPPQRSRSSVPSLLFVTFLLFMLTNHNGDEFLARRQYQHALQSLEYQLGNFSAWMNGTSSSFSLVSPPFYCHEVHWLIKTSQNQILRWSRLWALSWRLEPGWTLMKRHITPILQALSAAMWRSTISHRLLFPYLMVGKHTRKALWTERIWQKSRRGQTRGIGQGPIK